MNTDKNPGGKAVPSEARICVHLCASVVELNCFGLDRQLFGDCGRQFPAAAERLDQLDTGRQLFHL